MVELIERDYDEAREAGRLNEWDAMPLLESEDLVVVSKHRLELYMARLDHVENELCRRTVDESLESMKAQGIVLLSPEDLEDEESFLGEKSSRVPRARHIDGRARAPKMSFVDMLRTMFVKRMKQVG